MSDTFVTLRAEEIREATGCSWEHACTIAEQERDRCATADAMIGTLRAIGADAHSAAYDLEIDHAPTRADLPALISERVWCPTCGAPAGQPCAWKGHARKWAICNARHLAARRADFRADLRADR